MKRWCQCCQCKGDLPICTMHYFQQGDITAGVILGDMRGHMRHDAFTLTLLQSYTLILLQPFNSYDL